MKRCPPALVAALVLSMSSPALAGPYADEMARCLVRSTSPADRNALVRWLFAAGAMHPEVMAIVSVSDAQRDELNRGMARLLERLLAESCRAETHDAGKYEGSGSFEAAFQVLGQVAGRELFSHPAVAGSMTEVTKYLDKHKLEGLAPAGK